MKANRTTLLHSTFLLSLILALGGLIAKPAAARSCSPSPGTISATAFQSLLTDCAGNTITFMTGTYRFAPSGYATGFTIPGGAAGAPTILKGAGATGSSRTIFQVADSGSYQALLWVKDVSNVTIEDIDFEGIDTNNQSYPSGCAAHPLLDYGRAIYIYSSNGASADVEGVIVQNNLFHDFNGESWVAVNAANGSPGIGLFTTISISNNSFTSDASLNGGCQATQGYAAFMTWLHGSTDSTTAGLVENVSIGSNTFNASYIQGAVSVWSNSKRVSIQYNQINGAGNKLPTVIPPGGSDNEPEPKRYAILVYDDGYAPDTIWIVGNKIASPESCGVYAASATNLDISSNAIAGQTDIYDGTIPKGAIALNHSTTMASNPIYSNNLQSNYVGMSIVGGSIYTSTNTIGVTGRGFGTNGSLGGFGMKLWLVNGGTLRIQDITVSTTAIANATSVVGYGTAGDPSFLGVAQSGWTVTGGENPGLSWYSVPGSAAYTQFSQVRAMTFGNTSNPITADGVVQTAFWQP